MVAWWDDGLMGCGIACAGGCDGGVRVAAVRLADPRTVCRAVADQSNFSPISR